MELEMVTIASEVLTGTAFAEVSRNPVRSNRKLERPGALLKNRRVKITPSPEIPGADKGREVEISILPTDGSTRWTNVAALSVAIQQPSACNCYDLQFLRIVKDLHRRRPDPVGAFQDYIHG